MATVTLVNDLHSQLNPTAVSEIVAVRFIGDAQQAVRLAAATGRKIAIAGGRHAMGGQQFGNDAILLDMTGLSDVIAFDDINGTVTVSGGMQWPQLIDYLCARGQGWTIAQKQTGCDNLSIGGAISANIHGRGLTMKPFIGDLIDVQLVNADGDLVFCSRTENSELFSLVCGGYGMFGVVVSATLRLVRRVALRRVVEIIDCRDLHRKFQERIDAGHLYGDFQFSIDQTSSDFLRKGVFSTYVPVDGCDDQIDSNQALSTAQWRELLYLAHCDKSHAFDLYAGHYLRTNGQVYSSDRFQLATYIDNYHKELDVRLKAEVCGTEIITEIYVPRARIGDFLLAAGHVLREHNADLIYGTVRLIDKDDESFLAWARESFACTIFNLHTEHSPAGIARAAAAFRALIDLSIVFGGNYYLTYHKFATPEQLLRCYPQFPLFMERKLQYDPRETFSSNWYRHYRI